MCEVYSNIYQRYQDFNWRDGYFHSQQKLLVLAYPSSRNNSLLTCPVSRWTICFTSSRNHVHLLHSLLSLSIWSVTYLSSLAIHRTDSHQYRELPHICHLLSLLVQVIEVDRWAGIRWSKVDDVNSGVHATGSMEDHDLSHLKNQQRNKKPGIGWAGV